MKQLMTAFWPDDPIATDNLKGLRQQKQNP